MPSASGIRAGAAYIELYVKDNRLVKGLDAAAQKLSAFGASLTAIGTRMATFGAGIVTPLLGAAKVFADMGSDLDDMSQRTGVSVEALSELGFAAEQSGSDLGTLENGLRRMQKLVGDAARGLGSANEAFARLGLPADDLAKLTPEEQFKLIADRLSQIEDPTLRAAIAMEVFGRSGTNLLPLMQDGAAGIEELQQQARDLGLTMSTEDAQAAAAFGDAMDMLWSVLKKAVFTIGSALAPVLMQVVETMTRAATSVSAWIAENKELVATVFRIGVAVAAGGAALVALGAAISGLGVVLGAIGTAITGAGAAIGALGSMLAALLSPIGMVIAGVGALAAYLLYATGAGSQALQWLSDRFQDLKDTALAAWQGIGDALAAGDLSLAAKILWLTLKMEWQNGVNFLHAKWLEFKGLFISTWSSAVYSVARLATDAWANLQVAWVETTDFLADSWSVFINLLMKGWNRFAGFFQKVWARIKGLFGDIDAEAEVARINSEIGAEDERLDEDRNQAILDREKARRAARTRIEEERAGAQESLDQIQAQDQAEREVKHQAALRESEEELAKARREWQEAIDAAAKKRGEADVSVTDPARLRRTQAELPTPEGLDEMIDTTQKKVDVVGTFNPLAARGLGADSLAERTAKAAEQIAANTKRLVQEAQHGGLVFA